LAFLIDTNIAIHARDGVDAVLEKLAAHEGAVLISALSLAELQRGLYKDTQEGQLRKARLDVLLADIPILPFGEAAAVAYGRIIAQRGWSRRRDFDRMIAAHALATASILVTNNQADFRDIPGLTLANWFI
jgi:tRNA(fMet)-specific endonuclease VapC